MRFTFYSAIIVAALNASANAQVVEEEEMALAELSTADLENYTLGQLNAEIAFLEESPESLLA